MKKIMRSFGWLCLLLGLSACTATRPYVAREHDPWQDQVPPAEAAVAYRAFLIGDTEAADEAETPVLRLLKGQLEAAGDRSVVVFLGDHLAGGGMPDSAAAGRARAEARLGARLDLLRAYRGRVFFIPGDGDWDHGRAGGQAALDREEQFIETYLGRGNIFLPDEGFPGPVEVDLTDRITLVAIDSQWWLHPRERPFGDTGDYDLEEDGDFLLQLDDVVKRNRDRDLLVVGHHPVRSNGLHGGYRPLRDHLFPLVNLHPNAYVPLPVVGSLYPLSARYLGGRQDLSHPRYKQFRRALLKTFAQHERLIYASGHDHSLQYFMEGGRPFQPNRQHYLVSGAGSKPAFVARGRGAEFAAREPGFMVLTYYGDGAVWLEAWTPVGDGQTGRVLFRTQLNEAAPELVDPGLLAQGGTNGPDYRDSTMTLAANPAYAAGPLKALFLGSHNRRAWTTPVQAPVLDLGHVAGGLTPVQRGGGLQTISLRLKGGDGKEYVLRSIDKDPSNTVPENLQGTVATDIIQDQIASLHPYGAFIARPLARAAGLYHTNPRLFYVPDDPRLGIYREDFGGRLMMLEERPDDDMSDVEGLKGARDVISPHKLYRELDADNDHRVDQRAFARARLFDMLISDWDRHREQWRWAAFEPHELDPSLEGEARTEGKIYRPVPRDRDWAFNRLNGLFPSIVRTKYLMPKFQDFDYSYGYLPGLNQNGMEQDRRFTNALTQRDWVEIADSLRIALTDEVIEEALRSWPASIHALDGPRFSDVLKARRDRLPEVAARFYRLNARVVDVVGSHKHERFEVRRLNDDETEVVVYKTTKEGELRRELYRRTFHRDETEEVRLYGLDGQDRFVVSGEVGRGIRVIAVGGPGEDTFVDTSRVGGWGKQTRFYDSEAGGTWQPGPETKLVRSEDPAVNTYDSFSYQHDMEQPVAYFGSNKDDGLFVGGGVKLIRHGFRKTPYARSHTLKGNVAAKTGGFNVVYQGHFVRVFGGWDAAFEASYLSPDNIRNFYGLGNETLNTEADARYYQARLTQLTLVPSLLKRVEQGATLRLGPVLEYTKVREDTLRFIGQPQAGISEGTFGDQWFAGVEAELLLENLDDRLNPKQGFRWINGVDVNGSLRGSGESYSRLRSDLAFYLSPSLSPQVTLAARVGGAHNLGDFPFFSANTLGGTSNLRGYRSTRFAGRTSLYQNVELRLGLTRFTAYVALGELGLLGFFDNGRVWTDGETSRTWHQGYGGGLWMSLYERFVLTSTLGFSQDEKRTFTLQLGFLY